MNRMGSRASGGIRDRLATKGASPARASGRAPRMTPKVSPMRAAVPTPWDSRRRLAQVSAHSSISPVRLLGSKARRCIDSPRVAKLGSSLSLGFSARRASEATM